MKVKIFHDHTQLLCEVPAVRQNPVVARVSGVRHPADTNTQNSR
jgi:hypothetical protein